MTIIRSEFTPRTFVLYLLHKFLNAKSHIPGALSTCTVGFLNLQTSFLRSLYHHLSKKYSTPMVMVKESNPGRNQLIVGEGGDMPIVNQSRPTFAVRHSWFQRCPMCNDRLRCKLNVYAIYKPQPQMAL